MQDIITVNLSSDLRAALEEALRESGQSSNELVSEALRDYLFIRKFRLLREHMTAKARAQGIYSDEDVFERVS